MIETKNGGRGRRKGAGLSVLTIERDDNGKWEKSWNEFKLGGFWIKIK
jgi:hypothetical protein